MRSKTNINIFPGSVEKRMGDGGISNEDFTAKLLLGTGERTLNAAWSLFYAVIAKTCWHMFLDPVHMHNV